METAPETETPELEDEPLPESPLPELPLPELPLPSVATNESNVTESSASTLIIYLRPTGSAKGPQSTVFSPSSKVLGSSIAQKAPEFGSTITITISGLPVTEVTLTVKVALELAATL